MVRRLFGVRELLPALTVTCAPAEGGAEQSNIAHVCAVLPGEAALHLCTAIMHPST
jgi:hypothetical protein